MEINYKNRVAIDPFELDEELMRLPSDIAEYSELAADARKDRDATIRKMDVLKAEVEKEVRTNPENFGLSKITESAVTSAVLVDKRVDELYRMVLETSHTYNLLLGAVESFKAKKDSMKELVRLYELEYWSGPTTTKMVEAGKRISTSEAQRARREEADNLSRQPKNRRRRTPKENDNE